MTLPTKRPELFIFKLTQDERRAPGTYRRAIVVAESEVEAAKRHPRSWHFDEDGWGSDALLWASHPDKVQVRRIGAVDNGAYTEPMVICAIPSD